MVTKGKIECVKDVFADMLGTTTSNGFIVGNAYCDDASCNWCASIFTDETPDMADVRAAAKKHVRKTGHAVTVEKGDSTTYSVSN